MKTLLIVLGIIYLVVTVLVFIVQALISVYSDLDQSSYNMKMILKQSFGWPVILIKLIARK